MPNFTSIALSDHFSSFVDAQVESGRYRSPAEVVSAGLRLLEQNEAWRAREAEAEAVADGQKNIERIAPVVLRGGRSGSLAN